jgi:carboxymethylenebutenolidase
MHELSITVGGESVPAIMALPAGDLGAGVLVVQEWWGLVPHIRDVVQRFANAGFVAMAVDHYRGQATTEPDEAQKLMMGLRIGQVADELAVAADTLLDQPAVNSTGVGVVGFCMGGGLALLGPTVSDAITAAVAFYPAMPWPDYAPDWSRYRSKAALIHKAESDEPSTGAAIADYVRQIERHGGQVQVDEYPGSVHAFFNDDRPEVFQADHARRAWEQTCVFLAARS